MGLEKKGHWEFFFSFFFFFLFFFFYKHAPISQRFLVLVFLWHIPLVHFEKIVSVLDSIWKLDLLSLCIYPKKGFEVTLQVVEKIQLSSNKSYNQTFASKKVLINCWMQQLVSYRMSANLLHLSFFVPIRETILSQLYRDQ